MDHAPLSNPDPLLDRKRAADYIGLSNHKTMEVWATHRHGPPYLKYGPKGVVRYRISDLDAWLESQLVRHRKAPCPHCGGAL